MDNARMPSSQLTSHLAISYIYTTQTVTKIQLRDGQLAQLYQHSHAEVPMKFTEIYEVQKIRKCEQLQLHRQMWLIVLCFRHTQLCTYDNKQLASQSKCDAVNHAHIIVAIALFLLHAKVVCYCGTFIRSLVSSRLL